MSQSTDQQTTHEPSSSQAPNVPPAMERAEFLVDAFGSRLGQWTNGLGDSLRRLWARTREEGEDIWAEARDIRARNHIGTGATGGTVDTSTSSGASTLH